MKYSRILAALLSLLLLSGCSIVPFQTPEEQRAALEAAEVLRQEAQAEADPFAALSGEYTLSRTLTNAAGVELASYRVAYPKFSEDGQKAQSFARINSYYENEISGLTQDAYSFFNVVKAAYGEEWDTVTLADKLFSVNISYELVKAPEGYLTVRCDFRVEENGQVENYSQAQVFLLDNGWRLTMEALLGEQYDTAAPKLTASILAWCNNNGITVTNPDKRTLEEFSGNFALTEEGFLFYTEPFQLSNKNSNRYSIPVSRSGFRSVLED